jgi:hypothetical protein
VRLADVPVKRFYYACPDAPQGPQARTNLLPPAVRRLGPSSPRQGKEVSRIIPKYPQNLRGSPGP